MKGHGLLPCLALCVALCAALGLAGAGCNDPVHDDAVAALGPEADGVPPGPLHRPGQPCLVCHDGTGPGSLVFATAGTIFQDATNAYPLVAATVKITDINNLAIAPETNCAGNFFVEAVDWNLIYPVHVEVDYAVTSAVMVSHMAKDDSCATCHVGTTASPSNTVQIYLDQDPMTYPPSGCPQ